MKYILTCILILLITIDYSSYHYNEPITIVHLLCSVSSYMAINIYLFIHKN